MITDSASAKFLGLSSAQRVLRHIFIVIPTRRRGGRVQFQLLPERVFADERAGRHLIADAAGRFGDEADARADNLLCADLFRRVHALTLRVRRVVERADPIELDRAS